jgi:hypothetical protein
MVHMNVASLAVPGLVSPGGMNATLVARSGAAAGVLVAASMNENTNRNGPTTCSPMMTGITDGPAADGLGVTLVCAHPAARSPTTASSRVTDRVGERSMRGA